MNAPLDPAKPALRDERLGLWEGDEFLLASGDQDEARLSPLLRWHVRNEIVAVPLRSDHGSPFIWITAPSVLEHAVLSDDGRAVSGPTGESIALRLAPQLPTNRSYVDGSTLAWLAGRRLRMRGTVERKTGERSAFVARMIWPEDWVLRPDRLTVRPLKTDRALGKLIDAQEEAVAEPLPARLLWSRTPTEILRWADQPVLALVLNGAQADDDESHAGHLSIATGRLGRSGEWADWIVNNFYPLDVISEKGILAGMVPMDSYLADLNSGQAYYRPSYMTVAVLRDARTAAAFQTAIQRVFDRFYRQPGDYHHAAMNSTGMPMDALRASGWNVPQWGRTSGLLAVLAYLYVAATTRDVSAARSIYHYLMEEQTRVFPRAAFEAATLDLLKLVERRAETARSLTRYERMLQDDVEAVLFARIPQIPSSRAFGTAPVASFDQYRQRVPTDRSAWETVPLEPRPLPPHLLGPRRPGDAA